jgi:hypothetical protein
MPAFSSLRAGRQPAESPDVFRPRRLTFAGAFRWKRIAGSVAKPDNGAVHRSGPDGALRGTPRECHLTMSI